MKSKSVAYLCRFVSSRPYAVAIALLISSQAAQAQTFTWDGGGVDNKYNTPANWSTDLVPSTIAGTFIFGAVAPGGQTTCDMNVGGNVGTWIFAAEAPGMTITNSNNSMQYASASLTPITNNSPNLQTFQAALRQFWIGGATTGTHPNLIKNRTWTAGGGNLSYTDITLRNDSINVSTTAVVSSANLTFAGAFDHTVNGNITLGQAWPGRAANIVKTGAGVLTLKGSNSNYNGTTTVSAGTLRIQNAGALGTSVVTEIERTDIQAGAVLETAGTFTSTEFIRVAGTGIDLAGGIRAISGVATLSSQIAMEGTAGAVVSLGADAGATLKVSRLYSDPGRDTNFEKVGLGTLVLRSDNSDDYLGTTTISAGVLQVGDAGLTGELKTEGVINNASLVFNRANAYNYSGAITGTGSLTQAGIGSTTLSGVNLYTGATNVSAGVLAISGSTDPASTVTVTSGGTLSGEGTVGGNVNITGNFLGDDATPEALTIGGTLTATGPVTVNLPSPSPVPGTYLIANFGSITNSGNFSTSYRGGSLSFTPTTMSLTVGSAEALALTWSGTASAVWDTGIALNWTNPAAQAFFTGDSVTFPESGTNTTIQVTGDIRPSAMVVNAASTAYSFAGTGSINGASTLNKSGAGTLSIATSNGYSGGTTLSEGLVRVGNNLALGTGSVTITGGSLSSDSVTARTLVNPLSLGGSITFGNATESGLLTFSAATVTSTAALELTVASETTFSGVIDDAGSGYGLTKLGSGTLNLGATNLLTGSIFLNAGKVRVGANNALGSSSVPLTLNGSSLSTIGTTARTLANSPVTLPASVTLGDTVDNGALTLSGILDLSADTSISALSQVTFSGALSGGANLTKTGAALLIFTGASSFNGNVAINGGALRFQNATDANTTLGSGTSISVASGATVQLMTMSNRTVAIPTNFTLDGNGVVSTMDFPANNTQVYNLAGQIIVSNAPIIRSFGLINAYNFNGVISGSTNASGLQFRAEGGNSANQAHTYSINAAATYTGNTSLSAVSQQGVIRLGVADALPTTTSLNLLGGTVANSVASLNLNGFNQTLRGITATVQPTRTNVTNSSATAAVLTIDNATDVTMAGFLGRTISLAAGGNNFGLTKTGAGVFTISGVNTYTGDTKVLGGTLAINGSSIADTGKLIIDGGLVNVTGNETISALSFGSEAQAYGTWGSSTSTATYKDDTRFSGTGTITVLSPFEIWANTFTGPVLSDKTSTGDPDGDGLSNAVEYVTGTDPRTSSQAGRPTSTDDGNSLIFKFKRVDSSENSDVTVIVQASPDLVTWEDTYPIGATSSTGVDVQELDTAADEITVTVPHLTFEKRFARLKVVAP